MNMCSVVTLIPTFINRRENKTWVCDPDGNEWEVFVVREDNLPNASGACVSDCCSATPAGLVSITTC
jgi:hypothetical protein